MPFLKTLGPDGDLRDLFKAFPERVWPLLDYHDRLLREESPLSVATRELIAAYVSGLNACSFCHGAHASIAEAFDVKEQTLTALLDGDLSKVDARLRPIFLYAKKLTFEPSRMIQKDIDDILAEGFDERAVYDIASVVALFNMMNRIIFGTGIQAPSVKHKRSKELMRSKSYYRDLADVLGIEKK